MTHSCLVLGRDDRLLANPEFDRYGLRVHTRTRLRDALALLRVRNFDALALDPRHWDDLARHAVAQLSRHARAPLLVLLAADAGAQCEAIALGAAVCVESEASPRLVAARLWRLARRIPESAEPPERVRLGRLTVDRREGRAWIDQLPIELTRAQCEALALLAHRDGATVRRHELAAGFEARPTSRRADTLAWRLRMALRHAGAEEFSIESQRALGYRLHRHATAAQPAASRSNHRAALRPI